MDDVVPELVRFCFDTYHRWLYPWQADHRTYLGTICTDHGDVCVDAVSMCEVPPFDTEHVVTTPSPCDMFTR